MSELLYKILGTPIGGFSTDKVPKDGDGDGMFTLNGEDNVPIGAAIEIARRMAKRKVRNFVKENPERKERIRQILLKANKGGFTVEKTQKDDIVKGIAIGRNKHGIKKPASEMYDKNGEPTDEAIRLVMSWLTYHGKETFDNPSDGAREVGIGGWVEEGIFYLDVSDIYDSTAENLAKASKLGTIQNQLYVAHLEEVKIAEKTGDWSKAMIKAEGNGSETLPLGLFDDIMKVYESIPRITDLRIPSTPSKRTTSEKLLSLENFRILILDESERK
jgi:hypothetical protein